MSRGLLASASLAAAMSCTCVAPSALAQVPGADQVQAVTLANGMQVIVWPDHDIPNIALFNWVHVGSRNEVPGITGLAHFFEHMMFNGTTTRPQGEFDRVLEANGARNNAFTSNDVTVYQDWLPRAALAAVFEVEADRLRNLAFDPKVIESERGVVHSERRLRTDDSLVGRLQEQVQATAYLAHPYQIPTIGWPSDIASWRIEDLKTFFATNYAPNNCTLVLVGDVEPKSAIALARQYFEPIPAHAPPEPIRTQEPQQQGERRVIIEAEAQTPLLQFAYHALVRLRPAAAGARAADPDPHGRRRVAPASRAGRRAEAGNFRGQLPRSRLRSGPRVVPADVARRRRYEESGDSVRSARSNVCATAA